jgi:hypothetical protein
MWTPAVLGDAIMTPIGGGQRGVLRHNAYMSLLFEPSIYVYIFRWGKCII